MSDKFSQMLYSVRRLNKRSDEAGAQMTDFIRRQTEGEKPDSAEFLKLLQQRSTIHDAMRAQFKLYERPLSKVVQDVR